MLKASISMVRGGGQRSLESEIENFGVVRNREIVSQIFFYYAGIVSEQTAAVAILKHRNGGQIGLVRFVQAELSPCVVEATVDQVPAGEYSINIHQLGDLSEGSDRYSVLDTILFYYFLCCFCFHSCGDIYCVSDEVPPAGKLGSLTVDETGTNNLRLISHRLRVSDVIGRSIVVSSSDNKR